jgi:seryl-tRNA synthetase
MNLIPADITSLPSVPGWLSTAAVFVGGFITSLSLALVNRGPALQSSITTQVQAILSADQDRLMSMATERDAQNKKIDQLISERREQTEKIDQLISERREQTRKIDAQTGKIDELISELKRTW